MQVAFTFIAVVVSTVNFLEVTPVRQFKCRQNREDALTNVDFAMLVPTSAVFPRQHIDIHWIRPAL